MTNHTLDFWIKHFNALPNWRQRWCTRLLKIEPCIAWIKAHQPATLYVGLRADEEERKGIYSDDVISRFPLREWGWGIDHVKAYLRHRDVIVPSRTDCARCYGQRLGEWRNLWRYHPEIWHSAKTQEAETGATFRSPGRDSYPAALIQLEVKFEEDMELAQRQGKLFDCGPQMGKRGACRVCSL